MERIGRLKENIISIKFSIQQLRQSRKRGREGKGREGKGRGGEGRGGEGKGREGREGMTERRKESR